MRFSAHAERERRSRSTQVFRARGLGTPAGDHEAPLDHRRLAHYETHEEPEQHTARFLGMWAQIARRYKNQPPSVAFELLNEPSDKLDSDKRIC